ncbi:MAG: B12-binding domain-containing radical SAM protein [Caldicoprobacterales bacterium]|jgi:radical SAM superfamily enzyme YgiQ (UPF0313 family)
MNIILTTLNSKYIHSNLALRVLRAYCRNKYPDIRIMEFTINDPLDHIISSLAAEKPQLLGFSCYIWNIRPTLDIISTIKKILPDCKILLGGPEVSYDGEELLYNNHLIDYIIKGEGEQTFYELLNSLTQGKDLEHVNGLIWRNEVRIVTNQPRKLIELDSVPFAYEEGLSGLKNKIIYYETSRGCPYRCQYCLSSTTGKVRFLTMDRVKQELAWFVRSGVSQVKLVDRTFNCNAERAKEIFRYLISLGGSTNFHFEMAGDLIDKEMLDVLKTAPVGLFQFEIGVQSTRDSTLSLIERKTNINKIREAVLNLIELDNIHIHLDLIAGLPDEDIYSMAQSVNHVLQMRPHRLQLGFLKLLKGSGLREKAEDYNYQYTDYPPYEVLCNHVLSFEELDLLKRIEKLIEIYYNSHRFEKSVAYLIDINNGDAYKVFKDMADYWYNKGLYRYSHSKISIYEHLLNYAKTLDSVQMYLFCQLLRFDFVRHEKPGKYPEGLEPPHNEIKELSSWLYKFLQNKENVEQYLPKWQDCTPKQILRWTHLDYYSYPLHLEGDLAYQKDKTVLLFDYKHRNGVKKRPNLIVLKNNRL